ncbi:MAG: hypothetical protein ACI4ND_05485, partial [Succinivibrio sp.]
KKINSSVETEKERLNNTADFGLLQNLEIYLDKNFSSALYSEIISLYESENTVLPPEPEVKDHDGQKTVSPVAPVKVTHTVKSIKELIVNTDKSLVETEEDVERYLAQLKNSMLEAIKSGQHILVK